MLTACCAQAKAQGIHVFWRKDTNQLHYDSSRYISTVIGTKNGLPSSQVLCLYQQQAGPVWIGTSIGVSRYDGFDFGNFLATGNRQLGKVNAVKEDTQTGVIWVMSESGLCFYKEGQLFPALLEEDFSANDICFDGNGGAWLATGIGPVHLDKSALEDLLRQKKITLASKILPAWRRLASTKMVRKIALDADGSIWFSTRHTLYRYDQKDLVKIWETGLESDDITSIVCHKRDTVFFTAVRSGLFAHESGHLKKIPFRSTISANLQQLGDSLYYLTMHGVYGLTASNHQLRFISAIPEELNIWLSCLLVDRERNLWIGMHDCLIFQKERKFYEFSNADPTTGIELFSLFRRKDGRLLMGANRGRIFEKRNNDLVNALPQKSLAERAEVRAILEDSRGWMWYATGFEGVKLVRGNGRMENITEKEGLSTNSNSFLLEDSHGNIWTGGDGSVTKIAVNERLSFTAFSKLYPGDNYNTFLNAVEGPDGAIWLGGEKGLFVIRNGSLQEYDLSPHTPHSLNISDLRKGEGNDMWVTTQGDGIWQFGLHADGTLRLKKIFTEKDGLHSNIYLNLAAGHNKDIWAASYSGITRIKYIRENEPYIMNYSHPEGYFSSGYQAIKLLQATHDTIWAATSTGLLCFNPEDFPHAYATPGIILRDVKLSGSANKPPGNGPLVLPYDRRSIAFEFSGIYFSHPQALKYAYRLSGTESGWTDIGNKRSVSFQNLSPGTYQLEIRSYLGSHAVSEALVYSFRIKPPFWQTWWFILYCLAAVTLLLIFWIRKREAAIRKKAAEKALVQQQLIELEIKAQRAQMNPHFIFNSLNAISSLIASRQNEKGLQYLSRFSKLLRMVVDENETSFISLKDELELLRLYLQLEALRFVDSFSYDIHVDSMLNTDQVMLPSFLVHPLVENAVWHGLLHKEGERKLFITFRRDTPRQLLCIVQDNGIGITAAGKIKAERLNGAGRKEKGLQLIRERLLALQEKTMLQATVHIEELKGEDQEVRGTKVTIELPIIYET
ncbi:histidine kinase [Chitinophaga sp. YIM B06452]|uniref:sensor histidine kinase n=1 Tax=Chitinophaga sp. YIM B06452 TaxID=3082158 RepID=UPI0031FEEE9C